MNESEAYIAGYRHGAANVQVLRQNWARGKGRVKFVISQNIRLAGLLESSNPRAPFDQGYVDAFLDSVN